MASPDPDTAAAAVSSGTYWRIHHSWKATEGRNFHTNLVLLSDFHCGPSERRWWLDNHFKQNGLNVTHGYITMKVKT